MARKATHMGQYHQAPEIQSKVSLLSRGCLRQADCRSSFRLGFTSGVVSFGSDDDSTLWPPLSLFRINVTRI